MTDILTFYSYDMRRYFILFYSALSPAFSAEVVTLLLSV